MSKIDELIAEYCPDGVRFLALKDVAQIKNGKDYKHLPDGDIPVYGSGGVMTHVGEASYEGPSVLLPRKGSISNVFYVDGPFWNVDTIYYTVIDQTLMLPRFFYHFMLNQHIERLNTSNAARPALTQAVLNKIVVPVPPLPVQEEIVWILDSFSTLEAELEAELEARRKQYAHYRDELLSSGDCVSVSISSLATLRDRQRKPIKKADRTTGGTPYYGASGIIDYVDGYTHDGDYLLISEDGANLIARSSPIAFQVSGKTWINNHAHVLEISDSYTRRLVEMYINSVDISSYVNVSGQPKLTKTNLLDMKVKLPPEDKRQEIVEMLDRFDKLTNDLSSGLPAEIEARRRQYEYYRDRLLSFDRLAA